MSDSLKMKKLIQQQINSGALNSFFNKGQVNNLNVGNAGQNSLNVIGNQNVDGLFIADKIGINTSNPTKPFEVNSCTVFEGKISVSASTGSPPYISTVTGINTKFKKLFNLNDLIIFPNTSNIEIYGIITVVTDNVTLVIELASELIGGINDINYQGFYINPGTIDINSDPTNLKKVIGTNTLFNSYYKNGDKFITINNNKLEIQTVNNIVSDTELYTSGIFSNTTPAYGLANYCAVIYDIIDDYGNMGLGTYNPIEKLDVDGNINLSGHIYNNGILVDISPWLNSASPATPPYTQNIYYDLGYVGIGNVSSNPQYLLDVYGSVRFQDTIINSTTDSTNITTGALTTPGGVGITKNLNVGGTLTTTGLINANGGITVPTTKSVLINGTSTLTVGTGATTLGGTLTTTGLTSANGGITVPTAKSVLINGTSTFTVGTGATTLGGTLTTTGLTSANGGITVPTGQSVLINGTSTLTVAGLISANGGITVPTAQSVLINGTSTLTVGTGATTLGGSLTTTGLTSANGGITVPTAQTVVINGTSTLTVGTGSTILGGTLTTTGLTSANGGITVPTGLSVLINGSSTLTVGTGATTLGGVLNVTTALTTLSNGLTVSGTNGISLNSTTNTINIGDGANNNNINIGTSGVRTLTVGNNTAGTKVNITAGTTNATDGVIMTGNTYLNNKYLNYVDITSMATNSDPAPTGIVFINGYFLQNGGMSGALNFTTPTAANIVAAIKNCIVGSCFKFTINNKGGGFTRTIVGGAGVDITNLISSGVATNKVATFLCRITNIGSGTEAAVLYDTVV
jgi:hypothetical protein